MLNIFPRIITFEVSLKPNEIMQAIHDNMEKEKSFINSIFNGNPLEGTTSGNQFDVRKISRIGKQNVRGKNKRIEYKTRQSELPSISI